MSAMEEVFDFFSSVSEAGGAFYLATVDGDQPTVRPLGFKMMVDGILYLGVGTFKSVYKQIEANPKVQLVAYDGSQWVRVTAKAVIADDPALVDKCFDLAPRLKSTYEANGWDMGIIGIQEGTIQWIERPMKVVREETF